MMRNLPTITLTCQRHMMPPFTSVEGLIFVAGVSERCRMAWGDRPRKIHMKLEMQSAWRGLDWRLPLGQYIRASGCTGTLEALIVLCLGWKFVLGQQDMRCICWSGTPRDSPVVQGYGRPWDEGICADAALEKCHSGEGLLVVLGSC